MLCPFVSVCENKVLSSGTLSQILDFANFATEVDGRQVLSLNLLDGRSSFIDRTGDDRRAMDGAWLDRRCYRRTVTPHSLYASLDRRPNS